jgi:hypothetical protein
MALTELQKARVRFHLGYPTNLETLPGLKLQQKLLLANLDASVELSLVGDPLADWLEFEGQPLCSNSSVLGRLENAWVKLGPGTIEDSLFVSKAGNINLRTDELRARKSLYQSLVDDMSRLLDVDVFVVGNKGSNGPAFNY